MIQIYNADKDVGSRDVQARPSRTTHMVATYVFWRQTDTCYTILSCRPCRTSKTICS